MSRLISRIVARACAHRLSLAGVARRWLGHGSSAPVHSPLLSPGEITELLYRIEALHRDPGAYRAVRARGPGDADSPFLGHGLDFEELRPYGDGDDLRDVDWRAFARSGRVFVKRYREERQMAVHIVLDRGPTLRFGTHCRLKVTQAARVGTLHALAAMRRGASVGVTTLGPGGRHLRGRPGQAALLHAVEELIRPCPPLNESTAQAHGALARQLADVESLAPAGARVLLLSDFHFLREDDIPTLARLAGRHAVSAVVLEDETERRLPSIGLATFAAPASGQIFAVDTGNAALREDFARRAEARHAALRQRLERLGIAVQPCATCEDVVERFAAEALHG